MPDKGIFGYCCTEDEQPLYCLNPAHLLCGSVSLFLEHMCYSALPSTQMTAAKSSTPRDFSSMISAELRPDWGRLPTGSLYAYCLQMQATLQKGAHLTYTTHCWKKMTDTLPFYERESLLKDKESAVWKLL